MIDPAAIGLIFWYFHLVYESLSTTMLHLVGVSGTTFLEFKNYPARNSRTMYLKNLIFCVSWSIPQPPVSLSGHFHWFEKVRQRRSRIPLESTVTCYSNSRVPKTIPQRTHARCTSKIWSFGFDYDRCRNHLLCFLDIVKVFCKSPSTMKIEFRGNVFLEFEFPGFENCPATNLHTVHFKYFILWLRS